MRPDMDDLYEREPIRSRIVEVIPDLSWQAPTVYEEA